MPSPRAKLSDLLSPPPGANLQCHLAVKNLLISAVPMYGNGVHIGVVLSFTCVPRAIATQCEGLWAYCAYIHHSWLQRRGSPVSGPRIEWVRELVSSIRTLERFLIVMVNGLPDKGWRFVASLASLRRIPELGVGPRGPREGNARPRLHLDGRAAGKGTRDCASLLLETHFIFHLLSYAKYSTLVST